jgi:hypothetical protein
MAGPGAPSPARRLGDPGKVLPPSEAAFDSGSRVYRCLADEIGHQPLHLTQALGHPVSLDFHRRQPDRVAELLGRAGLVVRARLLREPDEDGDFPERAQQALSWRGNRPPYVSRLAVEIMTWYCPPGTMSKPGRAVTI